MDTDFRWGYQHTRNVQNKAASLEPEALSVGKKQSDKSLYTRLQPGTEGRTKGSRTTRLQCEKSLTLHNLSATAPWLSIAAPTSLSQIPATALTILQKELYLI